MTCARSAAWYMIFFGTQPALTQVPPSGPGSATMTRAPFRAARCAQASPPLPPPITIKSHDCVMFCPPEAASADDILDRLMAWILLLALAALAAAVVAAARRGLSGLQE